MMVPVNDGEDNGKADDRHSSYTASHQGDGCETGGVTIREYVLERLRTDLSDAGSVEPTLHDLAAAWKERRTDFKLERGEKSWTEVFHEGHEW